MVRTILEITRHELYVALRTKRALAVGGIYLLAALVGALVYSLLKRFAEQALVDIFIYLSGKPDESAARADLLAEGAYQRLAAWLGNTDLDAVEPTLRDSTILPIYLWCTLAFLPFLILLTSFDQPATDLQSRSICYSILRARRIEILLGKMSAHTLIFAVHTALSSVVMLALASAILEDVAFLDSLPGLMRLVLLLLPFGLCYLSLAALAATLTGHPYGALILALGLMGALRLLSLVDWIPEDWTIAFVRPARWVTPDMHHDGLWQAGLGGPAASIAFYLGFATFCTLLAVLILRRRDL